MNLPFVTDGDCELVNLEVAEDDLTLQEEHLSLQFVPLSKYCWQIFFMSSMEADSRSALVPHLSAITLSLSSALRSCSFFSSSAAFFLSRVLSFFFLSGVMNPFFLAMVTVSCYRFWMEMRASRSFRGTPH